MNKATTTTFSVSDVSPATIPLPEVPYKEAVESLLRVGTLVWVDDEIDDKPTDTLTGSARARPLEACARHDVCLVSGVPLHPFVAAVHKAFMDHRPLMLTPDTVWLMIIQGVANHINAHAKELRPRFVRHQDKLKINVRRDDFVKGSPENPWAEVIEDFSKQVRQHVGSAIDLFLPSFTTTGPVERAVAGVVLLDAMRSYFTYDMDTFCGIPAVSLEGTPEDWKAIVDRVEQFGSLDLEWWLEPLRAILHQFVAASQGVVDRRFWQSLYKYHDESGGPEITGWVSALFPYLTDERTGEPTRRNPWLTLNPQRVEDIDILDDIDDDLEDEIEDIYIDEEIDDEIDDIRCQTDEVKGLGKEEGLKAPTAKKPLNRLDLRRRQGKDVTEDHDLDDVLDEDIEDDPEYLVGAWIRPTPQSGRDKNQSIKGYHEDPESYTIGTRLADLPSGLSKAPFRWNFLDRSFDMEFLGGFVGVAQDPETLTLRPEIGWAVRKAPATG
jgi:hypothetical protein